MPDQTRNLNSVTDFAGTLDSNDRIIMTDNKASLKALTIAILGKAMVEGYTGSSLAGASQSVKAAIDALNNKTYSLTLGTRLTGTVDFNTLTTVGNYYCDTAITATNGPVSSLLGITKIEHSVGHDDNYLIQTYYSARNDADIYRRVRHNGNWGAWDKLPNSRTYSLSGGTQLQANVDLDTLLPGNYYAYSTIAVQHGPFSDICGIVKVEHSAGTDDKYLRQTYRRYNNDIIYERIKDGNTWKDWIKLPARAEVDALNSKSIHITGNLSTFPIPVPSKQPNAYHTVMIYGITGNNANDAFMYLVFINVDAQNQVILIPIKAHGSITITGTWNASTKVLTLTSSAVIYGGLWALT